MDLWKSLNARENIKFRGTALILSYESTALLPQLVAKQACEVLPPQFRLCKSTTLAKLLVEFHHLKLVIVHHNNEQEHPNNQQDHHDHVE